MSILSGFPDLSAKRLSHDDGADGWYPYYAGFSLRFASAVIRDAGLPVGALVADPWVGSGTTTTAAALAGYRAFGADLNPFAAVAASARLFFSGDSRTVLEAASDLAGARQSRSVPPDASLNMWLSDDVARKVRAIATAILERFGVEERWTRLPPEAAFFLLCLVRAARDAAAFKRKTNPTWVTPARSRSPANAQDVAARFIHWVRLLASQSSTNGRLLPGIDVAVADARQLPLEDGCVDCVLASPPYCTRIDYAVTTKFELSVIGRGVDDFNELRRSLMGTTSIRTPHQRSASPEWPRPLRGVLEQVRTHRSHRSEGYYFRNLLQYFTDADASLRELHRVLASSGTAYLVLQSSYYKEIELGLPRLFAALARTHALDADVVFEVPVRRILTSLNSRSRQYLDARKYTEAVVRLRRRRIRRQVSAAQ